MKSSSLLTKMVFAIVFTAFVIGFPAFCQKQNGVQNSFQKKPSSDSGDTTVRRNRNGADRDVDEIDNQIQQLNIQMKKLDEQFKNIDMKKYQMEIDDEIKKIDVEKIKEQIDKAMKDADLQMMNDDFAENATGTAKLKIDEVKKQMEEVKANLQKQKFDFEIDTQKMRAAMDKCLENARQSLKSAKDEIKNVKEFTDALKKDGLIDKSQAYKIEVRDGDLYINDKKQSKEISDKYKKYYKKGHFTIDMSEGDDFRI